MAAIENIGERRVGADTHIQMAGWEKHMRVLCKEEGSREPDEIMGGKDQTPSGLHVW